LALAIALALLAGRAADAKDPPPKGPPPPNLRTAPFRDVATWVSVPLPQHRSFVVGLPERFWIQCPRHSAVESIATTLAGDGLVLTYLNARGGSHSLFYVGAVPLPAAEGTEARDARVEKAARDFVHDLRSKYERVEMKMKDGRVTVEKATVSVGGKKQPAWRTSRHVLVPAGPFSGPDAVFGGECVLFAPEGTESLVYLSLTSKSGGTSLDKVLGDLSVKPTAEVATLPRVVQLNDVSLSKDDSFFPVRLVSYASPAGFAPTIEVARLRTNDTYAEDRVEDRAGDRTITGTLRIETDHADPAETLAAVAARERALVPWGKPTDPALVPLATAGAFAAVFRYAGPESGPKTITTHLAFVPLDDKVLKVTWITWGDAAQVEKDAAALDQMLRSLQTAVRSQP
jgi:hypothetical protein